MLFLKPIDTQILAEATASGAPVITVEDGSRTGGLGSAVAAWMKENGVTAPLTVLGIPDQFIHQGTVPQLRALCGIDSAAIAAAIRTALSR